MKAPAAGQLYNHACVFANKYRNLLILNDTSITKKSACFYSIVYTRQQEENGTDSY